MSAQPHRSDAPPSLELEDPALTSLDSPDHAANSPRSANESSMERAAKQAALRRVSPSGRYTIVACRPDGPGYPGDLMADVVHYRVLRAASFRMQLESDQRDELASLESRLRQAPLSASGEDREAKLRAFQRYDCDYPAVVSYVHEDEPGITKRVSVEIRDMSAGGVKACSPHSFTPGDAVTLHVRNTGPDCEETLFSSRIAWVSKDSFGLMFAGPPQTIPPLSLP